MSVTVARLMGYLDVDDHAWNAKLRAAEGDVDRSKGWLGGLGGVARGVGLGLLGVAGAAGVMGLKTAGSMEQANVAFGTLLGSTEKAEDFLGGLSDFAANTPFEMPGLISASRQLLGVGEAAGDVIPTLTAWGDTAGALGLNQEQFDRAIMAVTQSMGKGKLQAEEMMQITEAGIPIWPLLAKAMGKPIPEIQKMMSEGKLLAEDVFPLLEKQMGEDYGGSMEKQSKTLQGVWSTLMDTVNMGLAKVLTPLLPMMTKFIPKAADFLGKAFDGLSGVIETVMGWFHGAGEAGSGMSSVFGTVFGAVKTFITDNAATFQAWWGQIKSIFAALQELVSAVVTVILAIWEAHGDKIMSFIKQVWDTVKTIIGAALAVIHGVIQTVTGLISGDWGKAWDGIKEIFGAVWDTIKSLLALAWSYIYNIIGTYLSMVWDIVTGKFAEITEWLSGLPKRFADAVVGLWDWIWERAAAIYAAVKEKFESLGAFISGLPQWLADKAGDIWGWIVTAARNAAAAAWQAIKDQFTGGAGIGEDFGDLGRQQVEDGGRAGSGSQRGAGERGFGSQGVGGQSLVQFTYTGPAVDERGIADELSQLLGIGVRFSAAG